MSVNKEHKEFHTLDMRSGWKTPCWVIQWELLNFRRA